MKYNLRKFNRMKQNRRVFSLFGQAHSTVLSFLFVLFFFTQVYAAGSLVASWSPNAESDLAGYKIYYGTTSGDQTNWQMKDVGDVNRHVFHDLVAGETYYMVVTAYDWAGNESDPSTEASAVATNRDVTIAYTEENGLVITWDAVSGATAYDIYKSSSAYFTPTTPLISVTGTQYTDSNFSREADTGSYYIVTAKADANELFTFSTIGALNVKLNGAKNLVSVPFITSDSTLSTVLGSQLTGSSFSSQADRVRVWNGSEYEMAWLVEGTGTAYDGKWLRKAGDMESPIRLVPQQAFWIELVNPVPTDSVVTVAGRVAEDASYTYQLNSGPNFVGSYYPSEITLTNTNLGSSGAVTGGLNGAVSDKIMHWRNVNDFDVAWLVAGSGTSWDGEWVNERGDALSNMTFKAGHGYIIMIKNDNTTRNWQLPKPN